MDTEQGPSVPYGAPPPPAPPPPAPWPGWASAGPQPPPFPGYGAPGQPGGPWGYGPTAGPPAPGRPARRRRGLTLAVAATAFALAAAGVAVASGGSGSSALSPAAIAGKVDPGLVDITTTLGYQRGAAAGTGMVLTPNGEVLTNNHVIAGATAIHVRDIGNGQTYTAKVVGYSDSEDVAVLQLEGASGLATVPVGRSSGVAVGQKVVALGNAEGKGGTPALATGHITGTGAEVTAQDQGTGSSEHLTGMIRTNANILPGDSGGPLVNAAGQVIGMDTAASTANSGQPGTTAAVATTAFAIPISRAISIADQIEAGTASSTVHIGPTAFLGVGVSSQSGSGAFGQNGSGSTGATIAGVVPGTPAAAAGLAAGDTIQAVGGHTVAAAADLQGVIELYHPGDHVSVSWTDQAGQNHSATVTLTTGPAG